AHTLCIAGVAVSFAGSAWVLQQMLAGAPELNVSVYAWGVSDGLRMEIGFLVDNLSALMMTVVTFVSLAVHVYTIGYMRDDPGYTRFFAYISLFTFSMLMLVMSNNFLQLFFGWEAVGLVSYLLIGFWYKRPTAIFANYKAFIVNRIGDFGFIVAIAIIVAYMGSLDYAEVFERIPLALGHQLYLTPGEPSKVITVICVGLFLGAMGKSAQVPLHVWLPDSMEGPTPISALIHAATMVTAGIFMVARLSPLFQMSPDALHFIVVIGATTALFMGLLGLVNNDIKRVVAYSTLSQLGYMTAALGAGAYGAGIFHLMTHAFFKALLFLAAGSVIIGMHHEQDMRRMGGLKKYMPITYWTMVLGTLALVGTPFFSGFYSKDTIIEAAAEHAHEAHNWVASYAYWAVLLGAFVTAFYSFRLLYMTFHGKEHFHDKPPVGYVEPEADSSDHAAAFAHEHDEHGHGAHTPHESPWVVTVPLILLAIPSV
ncbi:MAG: NADH-quinone oxidoreductase subunit L, partial [Steroidobacteraceae bacterium]